MALRELAQGWKRIRLLLENESGNWVGTVFVVRCDDGCLGTACLEDQAPADCFALEPPEAPALQVDDVVVTNDYENEEVWKGGIGLVAKVDGPSRPIFVTFNLATGKQTFFRRDQLTLIGHLVRA